MSNMITVTNIENNTAWKKQLNESERQEINEYLRASKRTVAIFPATLTPIRTNNLNNFSKDFFLPTTVNHAIKVQNTVKRFFVLLASLFLDIATFPIRFITFIPRIISNAVSKENPLKKYLIQEKADTKILESDHVHVRLDWVSNGFPNYIWTDKNGNRHETDNQETHWRESMINFIEQPIYKQPAPISGWTRGSQGGINLG